MVCTSDTSDAQYIERNECPICQNGPRKAQINPRRALQEHLRSAPNAAHTMWRRQHYAQHFKHGGAKTLAAEVTGEDVVAAVRYAFGEQWAARTVVH
jgi:hypothetical protein